MFVYREACWQDKDVLLSWRNDPVTRAHSFTSKEITPDEHERWFRKCLSDPHRKQWIVKWNTEAIGVLRLDQVEPGRLEVSIHLAPRSRYRGYGPHILRDAHHIAGAWSPSVHILTARIKKENVASIKCFSRTGFQKEREDSETIVMVSPISP